jgi:hypothetical protein
MFTGLEPIWPIGSLQPQEVNIRCVLLVAWLTVSSLVVAGLTASSLLVVAGLAAGSLLLVAGLTASSLLLAGLAAGSLLHPSSPGTVTLHPCGSRWGRHPCSLSLGAGGCLPGGGEYQMAGISRYHLRMTPSKLALEAFLVGGLAGPPSLVGGLTGPPSTPGPPFSMSQ